MNATELYLKDGRNAGIYFCSNCRIVHRTESLANQCCQPYKCNICGKEVNEKYYARCQECRQKVETEKENERYEKAEKLKSWDGWVFSDGLGYRDGYFEDISDVLDYCEDEEIDAPKYVWACKSIQFVDASLDDITHRILDNAYEDFDEKDLNGLENLELAIDKFNEENKNKVCYEVDYSKVIIL